MSVDWTRRHVLEAAGAVAASGYLAGQIARPAAAQSDSDWPQPGYDAGNRGYNPDVSELGDEPERVWTYDPDDAVSVPAVVDGVVYVTAGNRLVALEATTGLGLWEFEAEGELTPPAVSDGLVFVGSADGAVVAVGTESEREEWRYSTERGVFLPPTVESGTVYASDARAIHSIDARTGDERWTVERSSDTALAARAGMVFAPSGESIVAILPTERWERFPLSGDLEPFAEFDGRSAVEIPLRTWYQYGTPAVDEERMFLGSLGMDALPLPGASGEGWRFEREVAVAASPAVGQEGVYVACGTGIEDAPDTHTANAGTVYAVDPDDGGVGWEVDLGSPINNAPIATESVVCATAENGRAYALDRETGNERWTVEVGNGIGSPVAAGDQLYVASEETGLVVFSGTETDTDGNDGPSESEGEDTGGSQEQGSNESGDDTASSEGNGGGGGEEGTESGVGGDGAEGGNDAGGPEEPPASDDGSGPGFGVPGALAALGGAGYLLGRSADEKRE